MNARASHVTRFLELLQQPGDMRGARLPIPASQNHTIRRRTTELPLGRQKQAGPSDLQGRPVSAASGALHAACSMGDAIRPPYVGDR